MCAKFRRNHIPQKGRSGFVRILLFAVILLFSLYYLLKVIGNLEISPESQPVEMDDGQYALPDGFPLPAEYADCKVVDHRFFMLCYNEKWEEASWAGYMLTRSSLDLPNVERTDWYTEDAMVESGSAHHRDYTNSGYTRGHLVPAADMAFSRSAMDATFNMSNISPQLSGFNGGIWRELEELVRDWAEIHDTLFVVTGPVVLEPAKRIGKTSRVAVPDYFYKAILNDNWEGIAFLLPHQVSAEPVMNFAVSIDSLESFTGIEIFDKLLDDDTETAVEDHFEPGLWPVNDSRYRRRVDKWNNR